MSVLDFLCYVENDANNKYLGNDAIHIFYYNQLN